MNKLETRSTQSYEEFVESLTDIPTSLEPVEREVPYSRESIPLRKDDIVICYPYRTGFGTFVKGTLAETSAVEIGTKLLNGLLDNTGRGDIRSLVDAAFIGMINHESMSPGGEIAKRSGLERASAVTINMACASGLRAMLDAASAVRDQYNTGIEIAAVGGFESMSMVSDRLASNRNGRGFGDLIVRDGVLVSLGDVFEQDASGKPLHMGAIGGRTEPGRPKVTRRQADIYALRSQHLAAMAQEVGYFDKRIMPIEVTKNRQRIIFNRDEAIKGRTVTMEGLAKLRPAFSEGDVTPGNASAISDGGGAMLVMTAEKAEALGLEVAMRLVSHALEGVSPDIMGSGPIPSTTKALERARLEITDIDYLQLNEAFAHVAVMGGYALGATNKNLNITGGGIAYGHPPGGTGAMLPVMGADYLDHNPDRRYVAVTLCVGGGQGAAAILERV